MSPIIARKPEKNYTAAPEGLHQAVCVDVVDQGLQQTKWGPKHIVQIRWQIETIDQQTQRRHLVVNRYTNSLHKKALLRQHLIAWRGQDFTEKELEGFDLEALIGANCQLQIIHNVGDGGTTYGNIQAIVPSSKGATKLRPSEYTRVKDRDEAQNGEAGPRDDDSDIPF